MSEVWRLIRQRSLPSAVIFTLLMALTMVLGLAQPTQAVPPVTTSSASAAPAAPGGYVVGVFVCDTAMPGKIGVRLKATIFQPSKGPRVVRIEHSGAHTWGPPSRSVNVDTISVAPGGNYGRGLWAYPRPKAPSGSVVILAQYPYGDRTVQLQSIKSMRASSGFPNAGCVARKIG